MEIRITQGSFFSFLLGSGFGAVGTFLLVLSIYDKTGGSDRIEFFQIISWFWAFGFAVPVAAIVWCIFVGLYELIRWCILTGILWHPVIFLQFLITKMFELIEIIMDVFWDAMTLKSTKIIQKIRKNQ